jgi:hypothetical protein
VLAARLAGNGEGYGDEATGQDLRYGYAGIHVVGTGPAPGVGGEHMIAPPVIVVIDDSPTIRKIMDLTLQWMGLRMVGSASGVAGLAVVAEHNPAFIFLDIVLPNVNGY